MAKQKPRQNAQNSIKTKRKGHSPTNGFKLGNPWRFAKGKSGNPGGRPKLLSEAYREWLMAEDANGVTNASKIAINLGFRAAVGDVQSAKEIRSATEGDKLTLATWQTELVDAIKQGKLTAEDVIRELGREQGIPLIVAAGQAVPEGAPSEPNQADGDSTPSA